MPQQILDPDPYSILTGSMWNIVLNSPVITSMVSPGNIVRFDDPTKRMPLKQEVLAADLPELILIPGGLGATGTNLYASNTSSEVMQSFYWYLNTGDLRATQFVMPLSWALLCAMAQWRQVCTRLMWHGNPFVKLVDIRSGSVAQVDPLRNSGIRGWTLTCQVDCEMWFNTQDMLNWS